MEEIVTKAPATPATNAPATPATTATSNGGVDNPIVLSSDDEIWDDPRWGMPSLTQRSRLPTVSTTTETASPKAASPKAAGCEERPIVVSDDDENWDQLPFSDTQPLDSSSDEWEVATPRAVKTVVATPPAPKKPRFVRATPCSPSQFN